MGEKPSESEGEEEIEEWEILEEKSKPSAEELGEKKSSSTPPHTEIEKPETEPEEINRDLCPYCGSTETVYDPYYDIYKCKRCGKVYEFTEETE